MIIAAFAGVGKTFFCDHIESVRDFACMPYKYFLSEINSDNMDFEKLKADFSLERNPEYPTNYIDAIIENMDKYQYFIIPSDSGP